AREISGQRAFLYRSLDRLNIPYEQSFTNFILVNVGADSSQVAGALLKKGVIVRDMAVWGLQGYIRVSIGSPAENKRFIKSLGEIV
ncbi:MAG: aminotransferase class I/II-fold pyridoxal phosphate-dependent enzyme, partial [Candidatus Omnitrophica bacterium]|nr:aminotransferase class I/II-fold pyridoxal phosphate-dependent enzyme [Candidatus Omnitrophota bacterium]